MNTLQKKARNQLLHALQRCEETGLVVCASRERIWIEGSDEDAEAPSRWAAPWTDSEGQRIQEGDTIRHPDGTTGRVVFFQGQDAPHDAWRVAYPDGVMARLCLQIRPKGGAVVQREPAGGDAEEGRALPDRRGLVEDFERFAEMRTEEAEAAAAAGNLHASRFLHGKAGGWLEARDFVEDGWKPEPNTAWTFPEDDRLALDVLNIAVRTHNLIKYIYRHRSAGEMPKAGGITAGKGAFLRLCRVEPENLTVHQLRKDFALHKEVFMRTHGFGEKTAEDLAFWLEKAAQ